MTCAVLACAACLLAVSTASAQQERELTWAILSPAPPAAEDPLADLTQDQLDLVLWVLNVLETEPTRDSTNVALYEKVDEAMPAVRSYGVDIDDVLASRQRARTAVVQELDGERVRMPGYLLPLEVSGTRVTEFLLVPYVGACIHVPPPPPNQIVHVKLTDNQSYQSKKLFEPVWVTGVMSTTSTIQELYLVDGSANIDTGYSMAATRVESYR